MKIPFSSPFCIVSAIHLDRVRSILVITSRRFSLFVAVFLDYSQYWPGSLWFCVFMSRSTRWLNQQWFLVLKRLRRWGHSLKSHPTDQEKPRIDPATPGLYLYSTQATNRPNRRELIFLYSGDLWGFIKFCSPIVIFYKSVPIQIRGRYEYLGESAPFGWNRAKIHYYKQNNIRTCYTKVKESITHQLRICQMQHELGTN